MRQSAQFARRLPTVPSAQSKPVQKMDYSRPVSRTGTIGFALLSLGLGAMTFVVTIWGFNFPSQMRLTETAHANAPIAAQQAPDLLSEQSYDAEVILEPKTTERLPIFGGMIASDR